jgi:hypothetical protein
MKGYNNENAKSINTIFSLVYGVPGERKKDSISQNNAIELQSISRTIMEDKLLEYLRNEKKITLYQTLHDTWKQIQKPSKLYVVLLPDTLWTIKIHAIFKEGIAIYHANQEAKAN